MALCRRDRRCQENTAPTDDERSGINGDAVHFKNELRPGVAHGRGCLLAADLARNLAADDVFGGCGIDAEVPLTAWSLLEATRLLSGTTVNLGGGGALIRLPDLPAAAALLDVTLTLPDGPLALRAQVVRRGEGDLVGLALADISTEQEDRLTSFVLERFE